MRDIFSRMPAMVITIAICALAGLVAGIMLGQMITQLLAQILQVP